MLQGSKAQSTMSSVMSLVKEFLALPADQRAKLVSHAKQKATKGICFLCGWIVDKKRFEEFPREGRMAHLMLCCSGIQGVQQ